MDKWYASRTIPGYKLSKKRGDQIIQIVVDLRSIAFAVDVFGPFKLYYSECLEPYIYCPYQANGYEYDITVKQRLLRLGCDDGIGLVKGVSPMRGSKYYSVALVQEQS